MQIAAIKPLVDNYDVPTLKQAEEALLSEATLPMEVKGEDEGEQLTHILAAIWILEEMAEKEVDYKTALRAYTNKVRTSIS